MPALEAVDGGLRMASRLLGLVFGKALMQAGTGGGA